MFFIDAFLGGTFLTYGVEVIKFAQQDQETRSDPMVEVFPRVTKCTFHKFGPSGSLQRHDALCILALNILNEKIYIFMWYVYQFSNWARNVVTHIQECITFRKCWRSHHPFPTSVLGRIKVLLTNATKRMCWSTWCVQLRHSFFLRNLPDFILACCNASDRRTVDLLATSRAPFQFYLTVFYYNIGSSCDILC